VETASDPSAAVALFERFGPPALLIADLRLGGHEHGTALALRLRATWGEFPVLITTGETSSEALRETNAAGYPLMHKPITAERLREMIGRALVPAA
jgi:DNA-binding NtrC family response regulator